MKRAGGEAQNHNGENRGMIVYTHNPKSAGVFPLDSGDLKHPSSPRLLWVLPCRDMSLWQVAC
jgi:hypothetical protein